MRLWKETFNWKEVLDNLLATQRGLRTLLSDGRRTFKSSLIRSPMSSTEEAEPEVLEQSDSVTVEGGMSGVSSWTQSRISGRGHHGC